MKSAIIYRGPSRLTGEPVIVVATGLDASSSNGKTGAMVQTWILRADMSPSEAVNSGADSAICGACPHRGRVEDGRNVGRSCYVLEFQAPASIWRAVQRGSVPDLTTPDEGGRVLANGALAASADALAALGAGRMVRLGAYGDPAAVLPLVWRDLVRRSNGWTGYTHQWRTSVAAGLRTLCMASCDSEADRTLAVAMGWRTFRVRARDAALMPGEVACPASKEAGEKVQCAACKACAGAGERRKSGIAIIAHGSSARAKYALAAVA